MGQKTKKKYFAECRALALGKEFFLKKKLTAWAGSAVKCHFFAECHSLPSVALSKEGFCRVPPFAECRAVCGTRQSHSLPSARLCRVPPGPTLDKEWLRRVSDFWHSAKLAALGKSAFSRSGGYSLVIYYFFVHEEAYFSSPCRFPLTKNAIL